MFLRVNLGCSLILCATRMSESFFSKSVNYLPQRFQKLLLPGRHSNGNSHLDLCDFMQVFDKTSKRDALKK